MDEHGEHRDLCGSNHRSIIPYVHERYGCCIAVCLLKYRLSLLEESEDFNVCPAFYSTRPWQLY
jgi:hypothetical protein